MRHPRILRKSLGTVVAGCVLVSTGCTHNYYYGNGVPICGPTTLAPSTVRSDAVCEIPSTVSGGTIISQGSPRGTIVSTAPLPSGPRPPRVVVSEPRSSPFGRWRQSDPEAGLATTRIEGALDDTTSTR